MLNELIKENVKLCGYSTPTPVQRYAVPIVNSNRDLMGTLSSLHNLKELIFDRKTWLKLIM
jgi:hypothetical protein